MGLELPVWGAPSVVWVVATLGLVSASVLDRFLDDDPDDSGDSDGMGGGMGGDDDLFGGGGGGGGAGGGEFDDFDGMDEWDDTFEGDEGGGADTDELEKRIDDLEAEVASLSSTVSTVRSENEEISGTVEEIEEDVRNLLDIYEMVTRGINPFVDESSGFDDIAGGGEGSFGLFDDEEEEEAEDLDEDVASADADGFFDEELVEPGDDELGELDDLDDEGDDGDAADAASDTEPAAEEDDMNDDGKSFSELKEEYDAGEADWADDGETNTDEDPFDDGADPSDGESFEEASESFDDDLGGDLDDDPFGDEAAADGVDDGFEAEPLEEPAEPESGHASEPPQESEPTQEPEPTRGPTPGGDPAEANGDGFEYVDRGDLSGRRRKPYLTELPGDYVGDLLVMEWLEFLVSAGDVTDAVRAINYYERIEWIGPEAGDRLRDFLSGFGTIDRNIVDRPGTDYLVREHHTRSLRYITQLNGTSSHTVLLDRWDDLAGGSLVGGTPPEPARRGRPRDTHRGGRPGGRAGNGAGYEGSGAGHEGSGAGREGNGAGHDDGTERGTDPGHASGRERANGRGGTSRRHNGNSPRPMNDPNPRSDRTDPADGGWGDGR